MIDSLDVPQIFEAYRSMDLIWASKSWKKEEEEEEEKTAVFRLPRNRIVLIRS